MLFASIFEQTQPPDWDEASHGSSEGDDDEEEDETPIGPVSDPYLEGN